MIHHGKWNVVLEASPLAVKAEAAAKAKGAPGIAARVGMIVGTGTAEAIAANGGATIPVHVELGFRLDMPSATTRNGAAGYQLRHWGLGADLGPVPRRECPMVLFVERGQRWFHWRVLVEIDGVVATGQSIRVVNDYSQLQCNGGLIGGEGDHVVLAGVPDERKTFLVGGRMRLFPQNDGYLGVAFWAAGEKSRILWTAVSQSNDE